MLKDFLEEVALKNEGDWLIYDLQECGLGLVTCFLDGQFLCL